MAHNESESPPEKHERPPAERKLSTSEEPRVRTRSFNAHGTLHLTREYVGDAMDKQLHTRNLVKKAIPKDNAIFRAVCEQISSVQTDNSDLRYLVEKILDPIAKQHFKDSNNTTFERDIEILKILANITSSRIIVYRSHTDDPEVYEGEEMIENREIQVCETQYRSVYEPVYSEEIHEALAISQSIVYRALYEGVFDYPKTMVDKMINYIREDNDKHAKSTINQVYSQCDHRVRTESFNSPLHSANALCTAKPPQFPFCVCKSLDPSIYRNVEYTLYKKKTENEVRAAQNSMEVKFGQGARCQARDGPRTRYAVVEKVVKPDIRLVRFDDNNTTREFNVADLRPVPQPHSFHGSMPSLLNGIGGGPPQMAFLPGCMPAPPPPSMSMQQQFYGSPPPMGPPFAPIYAMPPTMGMHMTVPPPSSPFFSPPPVYEHQSIFQFPDQMMMGGGGPPPPPPPTPMDRDRSMGYSSTDSPLDTSVFPSTPLSSRSGGDEGRRAREKKPRALSAELTDSPTTGRPSKKTTESKKTKEGLTWFTMPPKDEKEKRKGGRRATEGDTVGEMNRPLQPKQHRLSTCGSQENDVSALPSLMDAPVQQMQQLQLQQGGAAGAAAAAATRANLPSLLPPPHAQYYTSSSEWTDDTVFKDGEGNTSQLSIVMNQRDGSLLSSSSMEAQPPSMGFHMMMGGPVGGCAQISAPNFTMQEFYDEVSMDASYSEKRDGSDLPNMTTTRFFYNLGLQFYNLNLKDSIMAPPADALPMPPTFSVTSPTMPPQSPFLPDGMPYAVFNPSAAPPNTPAMPMAPALMPPHLLQYVYPGVDGMPKYAWVDDGRGGGGQVQMVQGPMGMVPSPSPLMSDGTGQHFFFN